MARIWAPLPDRDFDLTEVAVPWKIWTEAGHQVVFATERGAPAACDPRLIDGVIFGQLGAEVEVRAALVSRGSREDDGPAFAVEDENYVSARWPGDAYLYARRLLARL